MFPILFSLGPVTLYTFNVFLFVGALGGAFLYWKRAHTEHFEDDEVFDILIISTIMAVIFSRVTYILLHLTGIPQDFKGVMGAISRPGFDELTVMGVGLFYVWFLSKKRKWDAYEMADFASVSLSFAYVFIWIGRFFSGGFMGQVTALPIGVNFPNVFDKRHPVQLYFALAFFLVYILLLWLEKRYRFFQWYKAGRHTANSGFILALFLIFYGMIHVLFSTLHVEQTVVMGIRLDIFFDFLVMFAGMWILFVRSGLKNTNRKKWPKAAPTQVSAETKRTFFFGKKRS